MRKDWAENFLAVMGRGRPEDEAEFLALADEAGGHCSLDVARTLLKSFGSRPDYGTQESVVRALASAEKEDAITAILEELPRLMRDAPVWAHDLVGQEVDRRADLLGRIASQMPTDVKRALRELLADKEFVDFFPNAVHVEFENQDEKEQTRPGALARPVVK